MSAQRTLGPWFVVRNDNNELCIGTSEHDPWYIAEMCLGCEGSDIDKPDPAEANAAFIVKCVNSHDALVTELKLIADWRNVSLAGEYEHSLRDIIRSMLDCADRALETIKDERT